MVGLVLWTFVALLVLLALAVKANPLGLAKLTGGVRGDSAGFLASPPWTTLFSSSRELGQAPDLTLQLFDGGTFRLADQRGSGFVEEALQ